MPREDAVGRLARQIDAASKSERFSVDAEAVRGLRRRGAAELHRVCAEFVSSVNRNLSEAAVELAPSGYSPETLRESGVNVMQISSQGRALQITFRSTHELFSTEKFLVPYVLEGELRGFNQQMLDRMEVRSQLVFFCVNHEGAAWRFYDWRGPRSAPFDRDLLAGLMQRLF